MTGFFKQFKYVITLANEGSFSKAADVLNIKQPSLSQYIKKIEIEVGTELFNRAGGTVRLTDAGAAYIETGRKVLNLEHELEGKLSDITNNKAGTVTVGIAAYRSTYLMPNIIKAFNQKYPGIIVKIEEQKRSQILESAEHGNFDICLTTLPINEKLFSFETVLTEENIIAVPANINLTSQVIENRKYPCVSAKSLNGHKFVMLNDEHPMQFELEELCFSNNLSLEKSVVCTSLESLIEMSRAGLGIAFIPSCMAKDNIGLKYYSIKEWNKARDIVLMYRKEQYLSTVLKDFILTVKSELSK